MDAELELVDLQIAELEEKQTELNARKSRLLKRVGAAGGGPKGSSSSSSSSSKAPVAAPPALSKTELERYDKAGTMKNTGHLKGQLKTRLFRLA